MTTSNGHSNGHPSPEQPTRNVLELLEQKRAQIELAKAERQLAQLERGTKRLVESNLMWGWMDGWSALIDRMRGVEGQLLMAPSTVNDRKYGANWPFWRTWSEHSILRAQSRLITKTNDLAEGALEGLCSYTIADGFKYRIAAKKKKSPPPSLLDTIQFIVDDFGERNQLPEMEQEMFIRSRKDGEYAVRDFVHNGLTNLRFIEPTQIMDAVGMTGNDSDRMHPWTQGEGSFGVITPEDDMERTLALWVCYDGDISSGEEVPISECQHFKIGVERCIKRGFPDFVYATNDGLKASGQCIQNMVESAAIQASVVEIREHDVATEDVVKDFVATEAQWQEPEPWNGAPINTRIARSGEVRDIPKGLKYIPPPFSNGLPAWAQATQAALRRCGVKWNAPEWLVSGDASNNNYASSLTAESPFVRRCTRWQGSYKRAFRQNVERAIKNACDAGIIRAEGRTWSWQEVCEVCELQVEAPSLVTRDEMKEAQSNEIRMQAGVLSPQTWCAQDGLDYDEQQTNLAEHAQKQQEMTPQGQPGQAGQAQQLQQQSLPAAGGQQQPQEQQQSPALSALLGESVEMDWLEELIEMNFMEAYKPTKEVGAVWRGPSGRLTTKLASGRVVPYRDPNAPKPVKKPRGGQPPAPPVGSAGTGAGDGGGEKEPPGPTPQGGPPAPAGPASPAPPAPPKAPRGNAKVTAGHVHSVIAQHVQAGKISAEDTAHLGDLILSMTVENMNGLATKLGEIKGKEAKIEKGKRIAAAAIAKVTGGVAAGAGGPTATPTAAPTPKATPKAEPKAPPKEQEPSTDAEFDAAREARILAYQSRAANKQPLFKEPASAQPAETKQEKPKGSESKAAQPAAPKASPAASNHVQAATQHALATVDKLKSMPLSQLVKVPDHEIQADIDKLHLDKLKKPELTALAKQLGVHSSELGKTQAALRDNISDVFFRDIRGRAGMAIGDHGSFDDEQTMHDVERGAKADQDKAAQYRKDNPVPTPASRPKTPPKPKEKAARGPAKATEKANAAVATGQAHIDAVHKAVAADHATRTISDRGGELGKITRQHALDAVKDMNLDSHSDGELKHIATQFKADVPRGASRADIINEIERAVLGARELAYSGVS